MDLETEKIGANGRCGWAELTWLWRYTQTARQKGVI